MKKKFFIILSSIIFSFIILEILLIFFNYSRPNHYIYDENIGATHRPNTAGWYEKESLIYVKTNSDGIIGPERNIEKIKNTFRIAILGDSFAEGIQVDYGKRFSEILEKKLNLCLRKKIEVINFAVSGMSQTRQILTYRYKAKKYNPDLILLLFHDGNDIRDNQIKFGRNNFIPYYLVSNGELYLDNSFKERKEFKRRIILSNSLHEISNKIRTFQAIKEFYNYFKYKEYNKGNEIELKNKIEYLNPTKEVWKEAWFITESLFKLFSKELKEENKSFLVTTTITGPLQTFINSEKKKTKINKYKYIDERLNKVAEENNFIYLSQIDYFLKEINKTKKSIHFFDHIKKEGGHWNEYGHNLTGEVISNFLCQNIK